MKKHDLLKAIGIVFLVYVVLSWIIPGGSFSSGEFTSSTTTPLGIGDLFLYPIATSIYQMFVLSALVVLVIGGLYGILNKTGVLASMVSKLAKMFKGKEKLFIVLTTIFYSLVSAFLNLTLPAFLLIPLSVAVLVTLGFDKIKAFLATFGAVLVGGIATAIGYNMDGYNYVNYFLGVEIKSTIVYSIILFVCVLAILLVFILKGLKKPVKKVKKATKKEEEKEELIIPLYDAKAKAHKRPTAAVILFVVLVLVAFLSMFNWSAFGITFFDDIYESITSFTVNDFAIFSKILGSISAFGYWGNYELVMIVVMTSMLIAWVYKLSVKDAVDSFVEGLKEMLPVAVVVIMANILLYTANSAQTPFFQTIVNALVGLSSKFNYFVVGGVAAVGSIIYSSYPYLLYAIYDPITNLYANDLSIISVTVQAIYGICSLIVPTSVMLVMGLKYMNISYKEWFRNAWKLIVSLLVVVTIVILIIAAVI
jgi:uncharacterized ion transporter superfamily protein YfcC